MDGGAWWAAVHGFAKSQTQLRDFTFTFHFHALEKEIAAHSSVLALRIPGMAEPGGLLSMGSYRVGHNWSDLAAAAAVSLSQLPPFFTARSHIVFLFLTIVGWRSTVHLCWKWWRKRREEGRGSCNGDPPPHFPYALKIDLFLSFPISFHSHVFMERCSW